jgi:hypothetical protein
MNKAVARKWVDALRSGEYQQTHKVLTQITEDGEFDCCLGVLCKLALQDGIELDIMTIDYSREGMVKTYNGDEALPPNVIRQWAGFEPCSEDVSRYAEMNDELGCTFAQIADAIEENELGKEVK